MTSSSHRKQLSHDRIVGVAAHAIRRAGYHGVGVADIMKEAGLTHGGFYAHFPSKDALLAEAVSRAGLDAYEQLSARMAQHRARGDSAFSALVKAYLGLAHAKEADSGCPIAALVSEMPRQSDEARAAFLHRVDGFVKKVQQVLPAPAHRDTAALVASTLIGTLQLARSYGAESPEGRRLLRQAQRNLIEQIEGVQGVRPSPGAGKDTAEGQD